MSDSLGLVDFAIGLVNFVFNLHDRQVMCLENSNNKNCGINSACQKAFGLVGMTSGLVNDSFSLPEWQAVKMIFFAPCFGHRTFLPPVVLMKAEKKDYCLHHCISRGYSLVWPIWGYAAGKGMVFDLSALNREFWASLF